MRMEEEFEDAEEEFGANLPTIHQVLLDSFGSSAEHYTGIKRKRVHLIDAALRSYLEAHIDSVLTSGEAALLAAEREFEPKDAVCRVLSAEVLLAALPGFLKPPHLATDLMLRQMQIVMAEHVGYGIIYTVLRGCDVSCMQIDLDHALAKARFQLRLERHQLAQAKRQARVTPEMRADMEAILAHGRDAHSNDAHSNEAHRSDAQPPTAVRDLSAESGG